MERADAALLWSLGPPLREPPQAPMARGPWTMNHGPWMEQSLVVGEATASASRSRGGERDPCRAARPVAPATPRTARSRPVEGGPRGRFTFWFYVII
eukprot:scaffold89757_cov31-Tisochrysis_lutea.AAC.4